MDSHDPVGSSISPRPSAGAAPVIGLALAGGLVAGVLLALLTHVLSLSTIEGDGWSLRGNGALIVPFLGLPVVMVAGIAFLAFGRGRGTRWWVLAVASLMLLLGLLAGLISGARLVSG